MSRCVQTFDWYCIFNNIHAHIKHISNIYSILPYISFQNERLLKHHVVHISVSAYTGNCFAAGKAQSTVYVC
jgi:hypothetical protein